MILPNFNHSSVICDAIETIMAQSRPPDELIIIDDASTDDSTKTLQKYASRYSQIKLLLNKKNIGVVRSLNLGIEASNGCFTYMAAADDLVEPDFFKIATQMLIQYSHAALVCGEVITRQSESQDFIGIRPPIRPRQSPGFLSPQETLMKSKGKGNWIVGNGTIYRRKCIIEAGGLNPDLMSFADGFLAKKLALTHGFCFVPSNFATWNVNDWGFSRQAVLSVEKAKTFSRLIQIHTDAEAIFPENSGNIAADLWKFTVVRHACSGKQMNTRVIEEFLSVTPITKIVIYITSRLFHLKFGRIIILALAWIKWRPYSLWGLLVTRFFRSFFS
ncbi:glycosyltransferase family 2 protein [Alphaproteobacteria bacterium]|nr:glycosyltransferase family 2 protein [Alphaproteobacteria bacterium]